MNTQHVLIVEDEFAIASLLKINLEIAGFSVTHAHNLTCAKAMVYETLPDVLILDWMLPEGEGFSLLKYIRSSEKMKHISIIMLTARTEEADKIKGLEQGADDYLTKPFSHKELIARINALLRRRQPSMTSDIICINGLSFNPNTLQLSYQDKTISIGLSDFKLLQFLALHAGRLFSRSQLLDRVWKNHGNIEERTVDVHIKRIRNGLSSLDAPDFIKTIRGCGYQFSAPEN